MIIQPSSRIAAINKYAFAELDAQVTRLKADGFDPIDFGVGDPSTPTPGFIGDAAARGIEAHRSEGYPSYVGEKTFREAAAHWMEKRFGRSLDPEKEVSITLGSKEAVFHLPEAFVNPGEYVLSPSPGYPPYGRGALFAEGRNYYYSLVAENDFLPDPDAVPDTVIEQTRVFWICQPHVPTGRIMPKKTLQKLVDFCKQHEILLCSDEAYIDLFYDASPASLIEVARQGILVFYSLSKRSCMTGYRCGWVAGDPEAIAVYRKLKTNIDSGVPRFVQDGAVAALSDEDHVIRQREHYRWARDQMLGALAGAGLPSCVPQAGLYIWQRAPDGMTGLGLAGRLMQSDLALVTAPGSWLSEAEPGREHPGNRYVRFALTPPEDRIVEAVRRLEGIPRDWLQI
ncbi:MAG: aminotransferase class I/II-fold pyridoxal phosphate-dependent enzyme [Planctomycetes bacterium]|nr:aminotransferase class I/II-fold pyridoxal phosphate-dependent enzyme [Planctomycetota bacterium]